MFKKQFDQFCCVPLYRKIGFQIALQRGYHEVVQYLIQHPKLDWMKYFRGVDPIVISAMYGSRVAIEALLEKGFMWDINAMDRDGKTPLMRACEKGHLDFIDYLLSRPDINVNAVIESDSGKTVLMMAVIGNCNQAVKLLLKHPGIDVNQADKRGVTALVYAWSGSRRCKLDVLPLIMQHPDIDPTERRDMYQSLLRVLSRTEVEELLRLYPGLGSYS